MIQLDSKDEPWLPLRRIHGGPAATEGGDVTRSVYSEVNSRAMLVS